MVDMLRLVHNIYFLRFRKNSIQGTKYLSIPRLNWIFNNYSANYPKYSNNVIGNFATIVLKNYIYTLVWKHMSDWVDNEKLYRLILALI
jgi:hypothetical protein